MATKHFCDGCDNQIVNFTRVRCEWKVTVENNDHTELGETFDLCEGCAHHLKRDLDPRKWARAARPAA